jgi:pyruvate dehydrogenase (quinone)
MTGLLGYGGAYHAIADCDLLLMLGTDFPYQAFLETRGKIAQIDIAGERLGRRAPLDLGLVGDIQLTLDALLPKVNAKSDAKHFDVAHEKFTDSRKKLDAYIEHVASARPLHPEFATATINELADDDAVFTVDTGLNCVWAARYIQAKRDRRIIGSFNHGSMASAMPQAIGAQLLYPDRQVVALCGDGGFTMLMGDLLTLVQYDLPIKIVVYNNGALGFINLEMRSVGLPEFETELKNPDFSKLAEAVGILGVRIEDPADVRASLARALAHPGPALIDLVTDPNALSLPPKITLSQVEGFAIGMSKLALSGHVDAVLETIKSNWRLR